MNRKVVVNMSEMKLNQLIADTIERKIRYDVKSEIDKCAREITNDFLQEIRREVTFRMMSSIEQKMDNELIPFFQSRLPRMIINELKESGSIEFTEEIQVPSAEVMPVNENKEAARQPLKEKIEGAKTLLIYDPYFFSVPENYTTEDYLKEILETLPLNTLKKIIIICQKQKKPAVLDRFRELLPSNIAFDFKTDNNIHDRVWLVNDIQGYLVGTSWQGIGHKLSFILPLPDEDTIEFKACISKILSKM